ncbi:hypothetical protein Hanom_Chr00s001157g01675141 [Helianthus anomalus]
MFILLLYNLCNMPRFHPFFLTRFHLSKQTLDSNPTETIKIPKFQEKIQENQELDVMIKILDQDWIFDRNSGTQLGILAENDTKLTALMF